MSLFNTILGAIDNPNLQASSGQLGTILNTVQQLSQNYGSNPEAVQSAASIVSKYVRSNLQQQRQQGGEQQVQALVEQFSGTQPSSQAVQGLFSQPQIQAMVQEVERRTGLSASMIQAMLPTLVPLVLKFLQTGNRANSTSGANPVLNQFLDTDGDGDVDFLDAMQMASRYLNP